MQILKQQGNAAFAAKQWDSAIDLFGQAIALDPTNHVLYSNRSAAYTGKRDWEHALEDAEKVRFTTSFAKPTLKLDSA
jgi:stress-induced-phosphoprotein 1